MYEYQKKNKVQRKMHWEKIVGKNWNIDIYVKKSI